ncbi:uncharacterized protein [Physcomitrium patens]|uniref:Uncharacterized protein n=1 Tax=Physcomitrium patens TaxID=3218 RepID=A0A2K1IGS1_PHYPA|nr:golgin subfamily A member 6-like protein 22 [Physcomitrium patens]XP_024364687.1 golgin subfamily A member 6-like protein 22 [Physcomitrium patens]XP_024364688.1 golgin subfamily A member 6-like protein 22 [Physcomitrium patens]XP_024364689.1 golgin subfamily A member 6-like protein 22 [Physcomitrium patens]PNR28475.1 hypothetical protein PHYPA_029067 [Physcomitrium patens]|eukprot:XP_024364686.1 golgin subfamily A member 6-like protein 22 [Physcomitrella patens]
MAFHRRSCLGFLVLLWCAPSAFGAFKARKIGPVGLETVDWDSSNAINHLGSRIARSLLQNSEGNSGDWKREEETKEWKSEENQEIVKVEERKEEWQPEEKHEEVRVDEHKHEWKPEEKHEEVRVDEHKDEWKPEEKHKEWKTDEKHEEVRVDEHKEEWKPEEKLEEVRVDENKEEWKPEEKHEEVRVDEHKEEWKTEEKHEEVRVDEYKEEWKPEEKLEEVRVDENKEEWKPEEKHEEVRVDEYKEEWKTEEKHEEVRVDEHKEEWKPEEKLEEVRVDEHKEEWKTEEKHEEVRVDEHKEEWKPEEKLEEVRVDEHKEEWKPEDKHEEVRVDEHKAEWKTEEKHEEVRVDEHKEEWKAEEKHEEVRVDELKEAWKPEEKHEEWKPEEKHEEWKPEEKHEEVRAAEHKEEWKPEDRHEEVRTDEHKDQWRPEEKHEEVRVDEHKEEWKPEEKQEVRADEHKEEWKPEEKHEEVRADEHKEEWKPEEKHEEVRADEHKEEWKPEEKHDEVRADEHKEDWKPEKKHEVKVEEQKEEVKHEEEEWNHDVTHEKSEELQTEQNSETKPEDTREQKLQETTQVSQQEEKLEVQSDEYSKRDGNAGFMSQASNAQHAADSEQKQPEEHMQGLIMLSEHQEKIARRDQEMRDREQLAKHIQDLHEEQDQFDLNKEHLPSHHEQVYTPIHLNEEHVPFHHEQEESDNRAIHDDWTSWEHNEVLGPDDKKMEWSHEEQKFVEVKEGHELNFNDVESTHRYGHLVAHDEEVDVSPIIPEQDVDSVGEMEKFVSHEQNVNPVAKDDNKQEVTEDVGTDITVEKSDVEDGSAAERNYTDVSAPGEEIAVQRSRAPDNEQSSEAFPSESQDRQVESVDFSEHLTKNINVFSDQTKTHFVRVNQDLTITIMPFLGNKHASLVASAISYCLLLIPLALVFFVCEQAREFLTLQKAILFANIYLAVYFELLLVAALGLGSEPMQRFQEFSPSSYLVLQLLQAFGYILYLTLQTADLTLVFANGTAIAKSSATVQIVVAAMIGIHYYITVFVKATQGKAPATSWKAYAFYSIAFMTLCLFARIKRSKKDYRPVGSETTDKKN